MRRGEMSRAGGGHRETLFGPHAETGAALSAPGAEVR